MACEVCCRFPEADSFLRPYFTAEEIDRAVAHGVDRRHFPDPNGGQIALIPHPVGEGFLCPAFDPATSQCRIYDVRPLDCQLYPLALMWDREAEGEGQGARGEERNVVLGWDTKCPFMREAVPDDIRAHADRIAAVLEKPDTIERLAEHPRLIGPFQDDVAIVTPLPQLTARVRVRREEKASSQHAGASATLRPLTLADRPRFEAALASVETPLAHFAFAPHFIWRHLLAYSWAEIEGRLCLFAESADGLFMPLPPVPRPSPAALAACFALMRARNGGSAVSRIENVPDEWAAIFRAAGYAIRPKDSDYLYRTQDLVDLAGDRYKAQRAACNRFEREYRHTFEPYRDEDREACLALFHRWAAQKRTSGLEEAGRYMLADSESAHRETLLHEGSLGLVGRVVRVEGTVRAYTFGYARTAVVFCVLLEVADRDLPGLAPFIFREFSREAAARGHTSINTMDDSGLPGLASSKRAYRPVSLVPSYVASES